MVNPDRKFLKQHYKEEVLKKRKQGRIRGCQFKYNIGPKKG
jgi:hypothetical protein